MTPTAAPPDRPPPDGASSKGVFSDGVRADGTIPDGTIPDGAIADRTIADGTIPDGTTPDETTQDGTAPDRTIADGTTLDETILDETTPDEVLLGLYAHGDGRAARRLAERFLPRLLAYATRHLGDRAEAEDVVQETLLRLWRMAPDWRSGEAQLSTWLYRVAANLCTDRLRRRRGVALDAVAEPPDDRPGAEAGMIAADRVAALDAALARLPERQRQAVILRHLEGLANPEIARIMDLGVEAVESLTARGKRALAAELAGRKEELGYADDG